MRPEDVPLEELLAGLDTSCAAPSSAVYSWMVAEGYVPGCHRIAIPELYKRFVRWWMEARGSTAQMPAQAQFQAELGVLLRLGKGKKGRFAYVARKLGR